MRPALAEGVRLATVLWGLAFAAAGTLVAAGWAPGAATASLGPRLGIAMVLLLLGFALLLGPVIAAMVRRRSAGQTGGVCPVGASCSCGHFNFKPRAACRQCGKPTEYPA